MCGVAGAVLRDARDAECAVEAMCGQMIARGPDGGGVVTSATDGRAVALGKPLDEPPAARVTLGPARELHAQIAAAELSGYMRDVLLRDTDAMSMAHGMKVRALCRWAGTVASRERVAVVQEVAA